MLLSTSLFGLAACNVHPAKPVEVESVTTPEVGLPLDVNKKVDVLLVVDNSGSMGEEQANLAANFGPFIEQLESAGADFRIGITTTDLGGPHCEGASSGGELHLSSCLDRPQSFEFSGHSAFEVACQATCALDSEALSISPTAIDSTGELAPRPWIQSYNGVSNLPEDVDALEAFQCVAPQGISGCGWESPLEATARALTNMQDPGRAEHGFLREDALLAILIITDEVDCSYDGDHTDSLFEAPTFWSAGSAYATSAACWNAGVACSGDSPYEDCWAEDFGAEGAPTSEAGAAMLHPVDGYVAQLQAIADAKLDGREVLVSLIAVCSTPTARARSSTTAARCSSAAAARIGRCPSVSLATLAPSSRPTPTPAGSPRPGPRSPRSASRLAATSRSSSCAGLGCRSRVIRRSRRCVSCPRTPASTAAEPGVDGRRPRC